MDNKQILATANAAVDKGDYDGFLAYCTDNTVWNFVGDTTLRGKEAVRDYLTEVYTEPPVNRVTNLLADGDYVIATGIISIKDKDGKITTSNYCDVWRFENGKMAGVHAYVVEQK
jgi:ketosteroid isomerase-like protein